jgi:hypothetical protein
LSFRDGAVSKARTIASGSGELGGGKGGGSATEGNRHEDGNGDEATTKEVDDGQHHGGPAQHCSRG